jgi:hypothetical protein
VIVADGQWDGFAPGEPWYSTDDTRQIALDLGCEVIQPPGRAWRDQTESRNAYLLGEMGDWYVVCDADERCTGALPDLTGEVTCYKVFIDGPVTGSHVSPMRLFRHTGRMEYYTRHNAVYADGVLLSPTLMADGYWLYHVTKNDAERQALKDVFYPAQTIRERGGDPNKPQPLLRKIPVNPLGALTYIGGGAWIPSVPARNLTATEASRHHDLLVANLQGPRPLYVRQDDQPQQQSEPEDLPAKPRVRTQRRKEK